MSDLSHLFTLFSHGHWIHFYKKIPCNHASVAESYWELWEIKSSKESVKFLEVHVLTISHYKQQASLKSWRTPIKTHLNTDVYVQWGIVSTYVTPPHTPPPPTAHLASAHITVRDWWTDRAQRRGDLFTRVPLVLKLITRLILPPHCLSEPCGVRWEHRQRINANTVAKKRDQTTFRLANNSCLLDSNYCMYAETGLSRPGCQNLKDISNSNLRPSLVEVVVNVWFQALDREWEQMVCLCHGILLVSRNS